MSHVEASSNKVMLVLVVASVLWSPGGAVGTQSQTDEKVAEVAGNVTDVANTTEYVALESGDCELSAELNFTPAAILDMNSTDKSVTAAGCARCSKDRHWCKCTYNGLPRVSCDPCCYGNLGIPQVCLD